MSALEERFIAFRPEGVSEREATSHARLYADDVWQIQYPLSPERDRELTYTEQEKLLHDLQRYSQGEPVQYIIGLASFYGLFFQVDPAVLIPRQETEELVHLVLKDHPEPYARVLDIGTGSGCIAIALQHRRPVWYVQAIDVSREALEVAASNARRNKVDVDFLQVDILSDKLDAPIPFDLVVSNPPYIPHREKELVGASTRAYEPGLALWVPDEDPLLFYRVIGEKGLSVLKPGGQLYLEVNEFLAAETARLLTALGYVEVQVLDDLSGKQRMVVAQTSGEKGN